MSMLVLGSIALDTIETERGAARECLGGSASHASLAASYFVKPRVVGVVGEDFPSDYRSFLSSRVDASELATLPGKTFRWHGFHSLASGETISRLTELNTYEQFHPRLSERTARASHVLLGNIDPTLQLHVLDQLTSPGVVACDTMSLWIDIAKDKVLEVMRRADIFFINEQESYELTGRDDVIQAGADMLSRGAKRVIIKRGSQPAKLFTEAGAFEVSTIHDVDVVDPTGAGDNFAGALMGFLASKQVTAADPSHVIRGMQYGSAVASYAIERFGADAHKELALDKIEERLSIISRAG